MSTTWVLATDERGLAAAIAAPRRAGGKVSAVAVGPRELAGAAAAAGPDDVQWLLPDDSVPAEAYAARIADAAEAAGVRILVSTAAPAARVLLGAAAARLGAAVVPGAVGLAVEGEAVVVERLAIGGAVLETVTSLGPVAVIFAGEDVPSPEAAAPVAELPAEVAAADMRVERREPATGGTSGVRDAARVVSVGRGLKAREDLAVVQGLADTLGAEIACSMPIADDFGWVAKERYIGRSGQHIAPRLYLALGISGTPQHMEGVRDAKVVAAVNNDPKAPVFRTADYGIVGDLYEVVPALIAALKK